MTDGSSRLEVFQQAARDERLEASLAIANGIDAFLLGLTAQPGGVPAAGPRRGVAESGVVETPYVWPEVTL